CIQARATAGGFAIAGVYVNRSTPERRNNGQTGEGDIEGRCSRGNRSQSAETEPCRSLVAGHFAGARSVSEEASQVWRRFSKRNAQGVSTALRDALIPEPGRRRRGTSELRRSILCARRHRNASDRRNSDPCKDGRARRDARRFHREWHAPGIEGRRRGARAGGAPPPEAGGGGKDGWRFFWEGSGIRVEDGGKELEQETGIEPATFSLGKWLSHLFTVSYGN